MFTISEVQIILSIISGVLVGFSLGLIGGGGSILAIPLLIYFVGFDHPHIVIGTTALAVGVNAYLNLIPHTLKKHVNYKIGLEFTIPGIVGVLIGSELGLLTPGNDLLFFFSFLMIGIAIYMLKRKCIDLSEVQRKISSSTKSLEILILTGLIVGFASGYFGIGGGFLIVPGLLFGGGLNILQAVGTSLMAVGTFGVITAARYAISGDLDIVISALFIVGGIFGGWFGARLAGRVPKRRLTQMFAIIVIIVAFYIMYQNYGVILHL
ncbi:MAG: sulfite exporter TauE/SafE family protein [Candidatus Thermoplasmatota archaeon]|nr:sulfite exporter TauE/SafE family protein [Candidatus Thermoplasmatota archaeon]